MLVLTTLRGAKMQYKNYRKSDFIREIVLRDKKINELKAHISQLNELLIEDANELSSKIKGE